MSKPTKLEGRYFPPNSSHSIEAYLSQTQHGLQIKLVNSSEPQQVSLAEMTDRLGSVARKLTFEDGSLFECNNNDDVDQFFDKGTSFFSRLVKAESSFKFVVFSVLAAFILLIGLYRYGLPAAANAAAFLTPSSASSIIDIGTLDVVDRVIFSDSELESARKTELTALFTELTESIGRDDLRLLFRDGGRIGANAIALPGGTIILTDQLVELSKKDDEIRGVLAHEIGHVTARHSLKQIYRVLGVAFMISAIGGDSGQIVEDVIAQAVALENLSYSRQFETEADQNSVAMMLKAGRDPYAFIDLLDRIVPSLNQKSSDKSTDWLATHPGNANRRNDVNAYLETLKANK